MPAEISMPNLGPLLHVGDHQFVFERGYVVSDSETLGQAKQVAGGDDEAGAKEDAR